MVTRGVAAASSVEGPADVLLDLLLLIMTPAAKRSCCIALAEYGVVGRFRCNATDCLACDLGKHRHVHVCFQRQPIKCVQLC